MHYKMQSNKKDQSLILISPVPNFSWNPVEKSDERQ